MADVACNTTSKKSPKKEKDPKEERKFGRLQKKNIYKAVGHRQTASLILVRRTTRLRVAYYSFTRVDEVYSVDVQI